MIIPEQTVKMLCAFCKKENEVNGNQDLSITNCFHCGENVIGLKKEVEIKFTPKKKIDKDELIVLLVDGISKSIFELKKANKILQLERQDFQTDYYGGLISELENLIEKVNE